LKGTSIQIWGDGSIVRDYVYIEDVASAFIAAADHVGDHRIFNIGSGMGKSLNDLLDAIERVHGARVARTYKEGRAFDVPHNVLDISAAKQSLCWRRKVTFAEGLARTYQWALQNTRPTVSHIGC